MACKPVCKLCDKFVISQAVTFTGGNLVVNLPAGSYGNGCKYCIVVAQTIPAATTLMEEERAFYNPLLFLIPKCKNVMVTYTLLTNTEN